MTLTGLKRVLGWNALLCAAVLLTGCGTSDPNPGDRVFPGAPTAVGSSGATTNAFDEGFAILRVGDMITVSFADLPGLSSLRDQQMRIPDSGSITLPFNVRAQAAGKTTTQLEKDIRDAYVPKYFVSLTAIVRIEERSFIVDGEVKRPGQQPYVGEMTVCRAIGAAGGFTEFANRKKIQVRRQNGQKFIVDYKKAMEKSELDLPVYPNDLIVVDRSIF